ncbi:hypothetical protein MHI58_09035 [Bacillus sp. FSL K6-2869]|uniref:hypothetical protein n=1 Tax=Bacillus sp. FSL K6-2869 TaxID=2921485 RepID=UPI003246051E
MRNWKMYSNIIFFIIILSLFLGDLLIYTGLLNMFFEEKETIWAGIIGFTGAVLGGGITYYGIRMQLNHRDRELFLQTVATRMHACQEFLIKYDSYYTGARRVRTLAGDFDDPNVYSSRHNLRIIEFIDVIFDDRNSYMSVLDYEFAKKAKNLRNSLYKKVNYNDNSVDSPYEALLEIEAFCLLFYDTIQQLEDRLIELKKIN